jgi:hypothetical protein
MTIRNIDKITEVWATTGLFWEKKKRSNDGRYENIAGKEWMPILKGQ